ncbi:MAG: hypothetical protein B6I30_05495 [Desulfobacteraceae bacterium 4572_187]|nr:MAG: hypothetical protein B6I30_05495 [Desulfobacteraceae bacterium 4572_187]RLB78255.1 MAG: hypothetical protein DRH24_14735 [Deltaproteobacteria bacterium]
MTLIVTFHGIKGSGVPQLLICPLCRRLCHLCRKQAGRGPSNGKCRPFYRKEITARRRRRSLSQVINELKQFMSGWWNYYGLTESFNRLRPLSHWIRRRLRALGWKHWKNPKTRVGQLLKKGM